MSRSSSSKAKVQKLKDQERDQKRRREVRGKIEPEVKPPRPRASTTSYLLPNTLLDDLQTTKQALQKETGDRKGYNASTIVRAALQDWVRLEMDDQIASISRYTQAESRVSE